MTSKFTPGPWKVFGEKSNINITAKFLNGTDPYRMPIAYMQTEENCNDSMANAQLMAAAPELLEACEKIVDNWDNLHLKDRRQLKYAIQQAKGEK